ncbi:IclR family transcriptional regulator [Lentzea sp. NPDC051208]|uniref:IclR family transcriptional regulator n=1 Tax=Lentzea sp. NPDC051208 TaxID=3154642 RepID=UPI00342E78D4
MAVENGGGTQAVERAMSLLACFSEAKGALRVSELCAMTGLGQSTVSRMMSTLDRMRFVRQDSRTGLYHVGPAAISLGTLALNSSPVFRASRQVAQNLAHRSGLGANVAELDEFTLRYLCNFEGPRAPKSFSMAGRSAPLHATALGKALLSAMSAEQVSEYFQAPLPQLTPRTITDCQVMAAELEQVRARGYASEVEELAFGRACIAAPIRDNLGAVVAAISMSGPLSALDPRAPHEDLALLIIEAADEISVALGHSPALRDDVFISL